MITTFYRSEIPPQIAFCVGHNHFPAKMDVTDKAKDMVDKTKDTVDKTKTDVTDKAKDVVEKVKTEGGKVVDKAVEQGKDAIEKAKSALPVAPSVDPKLPVPPKAPQLDLPDAPKDKKGASLNFPNRREFSAPILRAEAMLAIRDRA